MVDHIIDSFKTDHPDLLELEIHGHIPAWIRGRLYRNGPGKFRFGPDEMNHLFDGMAVIHCFRIQDGQVKYHNRLLGSDAYEKNKAANRIVVSEFGTVGHIDPCKSLFGRFTSYFEDAFKITDNDCVNVMLLGDQIYAMTETPLMNIVDPQTLERIQQVNWSKYVSVHLATAHPQVDRDGTTYNLGTSYGVRGHYNFIKIPPAEKGDPNPVRQVEMVGQIPAQWPLMPCYSHSFGMTQNYLVFVEQPLAFNMLQLVSNRLSRNTIVSCLKFYDGYKTRFHLVHKYSGGLVPITFVSKPFFVFHHINAFEDGQNIVVDLAGYNDAEIMNQANLKSIRDQSESLPNAYFKRYVLPLPVKKSGELVNLSYTTATARMLEDGTVYCVPECPENFVIELPQINYKLCNGKRYRFAYGIQNIHKHGKLVKLDLENKTQTDWQQADYYPGEPVYVGRPGSEDEDDGVILSPCLACEDGLGSFLLVLDAKTFTELGRAQIPADVTIPLSFHGMFTDHFQNV